MTNQNNNNDPSQQGEQMYEQSKEMGKKAGKVAGNQAKKGIRKLTNKGTSAAKKAAKKLTAKALKAVGSALLKLGLALAKAIIGFLISFGIPVLIVLLLVVFLAATWYMIDLEDDGNEQKYYNTKNKTELVEGTDAFKWKRADGPLLGENGALKDFYIKIAQESFWQILPDKKHLHDPKVKYDKLELYTETGIKDYYDKEETMYLSSTLLFLLDEYLNEKFFIYPEQFTKPVYMDDKTRDLLSLLDEKKFVQPVVPVYDKDGEKTDKERPSVGNHGLAAILEYKEDYITKTVEGTVTGRQQYSEGCECVETVAVNEPFNYTLPGYPETIYLVEKATTIDGKFEYFYKREKSKERDLAGDSSDKNSDAATVFIGTVTTYTKVEETSIDEEGNEVTETVRVPTGTADLYEFRTGAVYMDKPVEEVDKMKKQEIDFDYLEQYLLNYEAVVPKSVMQEFDFEERMDGFSAVYAGGSLGNLSDLLQGSDIAIGSKTNTQMYKENYVKYFSIMKKWTDVYGGDPYIMLAKMMLESGGNPNINADGLMQIVGGSRTVTATRADGTKDTFTISVPEKKDPDKAIRFAVMYNKNKLDAHGGNDLKALQAYNFDISGVFKDKWPELWSTDTDWLDFSKIEEARKILASREGYGNSKSANTSCGIDSSGSMRWGNTCYIPMVLQYYGGSGELMATSSGPSSSSGKATQGSVAGTAKDNTYNDKVTAKSSQTANPNANLVTNPDSYLVVVNKDNKLDANYAPSDLRNLSGVPTKSPASTKMRKEAASAFELLVKDAKKKGIELGAFSGYRSYADQQAAFDKHQDETISAKPGYSEHQTGLAIDVVAAKDVKKSSTEVLTTNFGQTPEGIWLKNNAYKYGFIIRYPESKVANTGYSYEPWHLRFIGTANATSVSQKNISLEEAIASNVISGTKLSEVENVSPDTGNGEGNQGGDFDVDFEKEKEGLLQKLLGVLLGNNYKEETHFYNYKNHISAIEARDVKTEFVAYQRKIPYSLVNLDDEELQFIGTLDVGTGSIGSSNGGGGGTGGGGNISPNAISPEGFSSPVAIPDLKSKLTSFFGWRDIGAGQEFHKGIDVGIPTGTPLYSIGEGTVHYVVPYRGEGSGPYPDGWGSVVIVQHANGIQSVYAHLSKTYVQVGQKVTNGTLIALSGHTGRSTGPHLHFEVRVNKQAVDPYNIITIGY